MMTDDAPAPADAKQAETGPARLKSGPTKVMHDLLSSADGSLDDKIVTVKTARVVDKGRFESAFKTLMKR
jgi:hypothetical protein